MLMLWTQLGRSSVDGIDKKDLSSH